MALAFSHRSRSQAQTFAVIADYFDQNSRVPTYRELAHMFGWASTNASFRAVQTLIAAGAIIKRPTPGGGFVLVPAGRRVSNKRGKPRAPHKPADGFVYVAKRGIAYKIGFSRRGVARRVKDARAELILTIPVKQRPAQLEYLINSRFASKRLPSQGDKPGDKREWFALDDADLEWLRGFASFMSETV